MSTASSFDPLVVLRARTRKIHERLEALPWLDAATASFAHYSDHIGRVEAFYLAAADAMRRHRDALAALIGADEPQIATERLGRERAQLQENGFAVGVPGKTSFPVLETVSHAAGCCYVLHGASLGGVLIARTIVDCLQWNSLFYGGAGSATAARWQTFCARLRDGAHELDAANLVTGARLTYAAFESAVASPLLTESAIPDPASIRRPAGSRR